MLLWHMHSAVLKGYYASEVIVMAADKKEARVQAGLAFSRYLDNSIRNYGTVFLIDALPGEEGFDAQLAELTQRFMRETEKLEQVGFAGLIIHHI